MRRSATAALLLAACVIGFRGEALFDGEHSLTGIDEVRIDLPSTPLRIVACAAALPEDCPATLRYDGRWNTVGGSGADAEEIGREPKIIFEPLEGFAALRAVVPLKVRGLVDLEMGEIELPDDRDLDIRTGLGDVEVFGVLGAVSVDIGIGDVRVTGADGGLGVRTGDGDITVSTPARADLRTDSGDVQLRQTENPRDAFIRVDRGDIELQLASDANVDLTIEASGTIRVRTENIQTVTSGRFTRVLGTGAQVVELKTSSGGVDVVLAE